MNQDDLNQMADPRDFRKRLTDHMFNTRADLQTVHDAVEKGDKSLIYQHDFRLAYLLGLQNALKIWDGYQEDLRDLLDKMAAEVDEGEDAE